MSVSDTSLFLTAIPVDAIQPDPNQPRKSIEGIDELAQNIRENGLLQPPMVRPDPADPSRYIIIVGERRWTAVKALGWSEIECNIRDIADPDEILSVQVSENLSRVDMNVIETAAAIHILCSRLGSVSATAERLGITNSRVSEFNTIHTKGGDLTRDLGLKTNDLGSMATFAKLEADDPSKAASLYRSLETREFKGLRGLVAKAAKGVRVRPVKKKPGTKLKRVNVVSKAAVKLNDDQTQTVTFMVDGSNVEFLVPMAVGVVSIA